MRDFAKQPPALRVARQLVDAKQLTFAAMILGPAKKGGNPLAPGFNKREADSDFGSTGRTWSASSALLLTSAELKITTRNEC
jgi:hypothetical protein